ncbi:MAG: phospho-sugar mutase [Eubacterium sp.]|nr:phospho-sugar mutase [Eubacterium sp.]MDY3775562.1 phospho-sugar mutase [Eubacterium sp.]
MDIMENYKRWLGKVTEEDLLSELKAIDGKEEEINDRFYRDLEFGTGGLRGVIGAGTYRMNEHTVARATQGYSNYLNQAVKEPSVSIAYDSRIKSDVFAKTAAGVFAANGIQVHIYKELMPTPSLSYAVRALHCDGGIVVTASHNPAKYNGYKVYGADGCQITLEVADAILKEIEAVDVFDDVKKMDFEAGLAAGTIQYIEEDVITGFIDAVSERALNPKEIDKNVSIVYTPLNGTGRYCVTRCLKENGYTQITIPKEQEMPDGNFTTCPYPNPEIREALEVGLKKAKEVGSDLLLATDPDCDRVGVAVREGDEYQLISGNQMGILLFDYICKTYKANGTMPKNPVVVTTIVSTKMIDKIAADYGVEVRRVLTGFKFIGEQIGFLEADGEVDRYIFGFEESYGYLSGGHVRDKDGVNASLLICEMFAHYKAMGISLVQMLNQLYEKYGYFKEALQSITFEGASGAKKMADLMESLRTNAPKEIAGFKVIDVKDYKAGIGNLPKSNVLEFNMEDDINVLVRPSGTEPKIKMYYLVKGSSEEAGAKIVSALEDYFTDVCK